MSKVTKPSEFGHNNPNLAFVDAKEVRGGTQIFADFNERNAWPQDKRSTKFIAVVYGANGNDSQKGSWKYNGTTVEDADWILESNWEAWGGATTATDTDDPLTVDSNTISVSQSDYENLVVSFTGVEDFGGGVVKEYVVVLDNAGEKTTTTKSNIDSAGSVISVEIPSFEYNTAYSITVMARDAALNSSESTAVSYTTLAEPTVGAVSLSLGYFNHKEINLTILGGNGGAGTTTYTLKYKLVGTHTQWQNITSISDDMLGYLPEQNDGDTADSSDWRKIRIPGTIGKRQYDFIVEAVDSNGNKATGELDGVVSTPYLLYELTSLADYVQGERSTSMFSLHYLDSNKVSIFKNGEPIVHSEYDQYHGNGASFISGNNIGDVYEYVAPYDVSTDTISLPVTNYTAYIPEDNVDQLVSLRNQNPTLPKITLPSGITVNIFNVDEYLNLDELQLGGNTLVTSNSGIQSNLKIIGGNLFCLDFNILANLETYATRSPSTAIYNELHNYFNDTEDEEAYINMSPMTKLVNLGTRGRIHELPEAYDTLKSLSVFGVVDSPEGRGRIPLYSALQLVDGTSIPSDTDFSGTDLRVANNVYVYNIENLPNSFNAYYKLAARNGANPYSEDIPSLAQHLCDVMDKINRDWDGSDGYAIHEMTYSNSYKQKYIQLNEVFYEDSHTEVTTTYRHITGQFTGKTFSTIKNELEAKGFTIEILANPDNRY